MVRTRTDTPRTHELQGAEQAPERIAEEAHSGTTERSGRGELVGLDDVDRLADASLHRHRAHAAQWVRGDGPGSGAGLERGLARGAKSRGKQPAERLGRNEVRRRRKRRGKVKPGLEPTPNSVRPELVPIPSRDPSADLELVPIPGSEGDLEPPAGDALLRAGVSAEVVAELGRYFDSEGLDVGVLDRVAASGHYQGIELEQALKAYAVAYVACRNQYVGPVRLNGLRHRFLGAITRGRLRFELSTAEQMPASHAQYVFTRNTIRVREPGLDLSTIAARGMLIHEAQHVVQDGLRRTDTPYNFEKDGHMALAEYVLRAAGAIRREKGGMILDKIKADTIINRPQLKGITRPGVTWDGPDAWCLRETVDAFIRDALARDEVHHIKPEVDRRAAQSLLEDLEPFETQYLRVQMLAKANIHRGEAATDLFLRTPFTKDGLQ